MGMHMGRLQPQEHSWDQLERIERKKERSHCSHLMRSAQSVGPLKAWVCDYWNELHYTTSPHPPICWGNVVE